MKTAAVAVLAVALAATPAAFAKGRVSVTVSDATPRVAETFTVDVRTGFVVPAGDWLRLIAVAPGKDWYQVVGTVTGDASRTRARIPRDGFEIKLERVGPKRWRARVRLPRPGRWRIVLPNATHRGFMVPPPSAWMPWSTFAGSGATLLALVPTAVVAAAAPSRTLPRRASPSTSSYPASPATRSPSASAASAPACRSC